MILMLCNNIFGVLREPQLGKFNDDLDKLWRPSLFGFLTLRKITASIRSCYFFQSQKTRLLDLRTGRATSGGEEFRFSKKTRIKVG